MNATAPAAPNYSYYDEAYFQRGGERGTAYNHYLTASKTSAIYEEIGAVCASIGARRALEIGCATGVVVNYLNEAGIEAHGIDVSKWAIDNRQHKNAILASADDLPFPDGHFDLVYSIHALEHIPQLVASSAFKEMGRVSAAGAVHFHTLPILGMGAYSGDRAHVISELQKDPTHSLLEDRVWWLNQFGSIGHEDLGIGALFYHDRFPEHSVSQLLLIDTNASAQRRLDVQDRIRAQNLLVVTQLMADREKFSDGIHTPFLHRDVSALELSGQWNDLFETCDFVLADFQATAVVTVEGPEPIFLRFVFFGPNGEEANLMRTYKPGQTAITFTAADLYQPHGRVAGQRVKRFQFGGQGQGRVSLMFDILSNSGSTLYRIKQR
jgi:SAM-dependent methyltransferase